jgi:outer membrane protein
MASGVRFPSAMPKRHPAFYKILLLTACCAAAFAQPAAGPSGLTLPQAIELALRNNLQVKLAQERTGEAQAQRSMARSALLPNVAGAAYQMNLTANLAAQGLSSSTFPGIPAFIGPFSRFDARVQAAQSLFNLSSIRRYRGAGYAVKLAEEARVLTGQQIAAATALAYIGLLEAGQGVAAAEANVQLSERLLDLAVNQRNAGIATGLDVARAETRLAAQQVQRAQAQSNLDTARLNLQRLIGAPLGGQLTPADAMRFAPQAAPATADAIQQALAGRLELQIAAEQVRIARAERGAAVGEWAPSVAAFGEYGSSGLKPNEVNLPTRAVGIRVDVPIFNGGRTKAAVQVTSSRVREAEMQLADLRAAVEKDVREALDLLGTREQQMRAAQKNLDLSERELSLGQDRFQNGVADNIEVTNAQTAVENARRMLVSSLAQFNVARLNLYSALGRAGDFQF